MKLTLKKDRMKISELVEKPRKVLGIYRRNKDLSVGDKTRLLIYSSSWDVNNIKAVFVCQPTNTTTDKATN